MMQTRMVKNGCVLMVVALLGLAAVSVRSQPAFPRTGQLFVAVPSANSMQEFSVRAGYNTTYVEPVGNLPAGGLEAIGFRKTDNLIYGIVPADNHLIRMGQLGTYQDLGPVGLDNSLFYLAGDVSRDGKYLFSVGSLGGFDVHLAKTDLNNPNHPTVFIPLPGGQHVSDITFSPDGSVLYGFDQVNNRLLKINPVSGSVLPLVTFESGNRLFGLYFDAFGQLYGAGTTLYGVVDAHYSIDASTGREKRLATGPISTATDLAACPYSVEMSAKLDPPLNLPCTDQTYLINVINGGDETLQGLEFRDALPAGLRVASVTQNSFGVAVDTLSVPGQIRMSNITLPPGELRQLRMRISVGDIPKGLYRFQARMESLPALYGGICISDNVWRPGFDDSTSFQVNRYEKDTLSFAWLVCHGDTLFLETREYGNNIVWNTGATASTLAVTRGGLYSFKAGNTCEKVVVTHDVTSTECPFTISMDLLMDPDTVFACSDMIFHFVLDNESGETREHITVSDTLPPGFRFAGVVKNPFGGHPDAQAPPHVVRFTGLKMPPGRDTLSVRVHIDDVGPGRYFFRAKMEGLAFFLGPSRLSDDPETFAFDSTVLVIRGTLTDTVFLDTLVCAGAMVTLDARELGKSFLWDNGSTQSHIEVDTPGVYHLTLYDGCEPAQVYWRVRPGLTLDLEPIPDQYIHLGESVQLTPQINNGGNGLQVTWTDPLGHTLSCTNCLQPTAEPLISAQYGLKASNEECFDSLTVNVEVDTRARIYFPNVFSPNDDGVNDWFSIQSPDFGKVIHVQIFDRWGHLMSSVRDLDLLGETPLWDGRLAPPGVYVWTSVIEFIDGHRERFTGSITLIR